MIPLASSELPGEGRARVVVTKVRPSVDGGRFPAKRVLGDVVTVEAEILADGHDLLSAAVRVHAPGRGEIEVPMTSLGADRFTASFVADVLGRWSFVVVGWVDRFRTWRRDLEKRVAAGQDVAVDLRIGAGLLREAGVTGPAEAIERGDRAQALSPQVLLAWDSATPGRAFQVTSPPHEIVVEPIRARFSAWYELFPRSASADPDRPGTLQDVVARLPYVAGMGFDVLYLPPIHPIGAVARKGRNNNPKAEPGDVGSPWAIADHLSVHPDLGTVEDLRRLVVAAREKGVEIALDVALQCSPDHRWVREHPEWFRHRPDGTIQHAENPPKKYEDIVPFDFECEHWRELWAALLGIFRYWCDQGVRVFRVDNPHTKSIAFWAWCVRALKDEHPEVVLLSEAFTRPALMQTLAKIGFSQSYTYFPWKNTKAQLAEYAAMFTDPALREFLHPNAWPNTPDILNEYLQVGGLAGHRVRAVLAATMSASWGVYGPVYELGVATPKQPGSEEYANSEKYEVHHWDLDQPWSLAPLLSRLNRIRRENAALWTDATLRFHETDEEHLVCFSKTADDPHHAIVVVANLDPHYPRQGHVRLGPAALGLDPDQAFQVHDLLSDARFLWSGDRHFVSLDPQRQPAHVFRVRRRVRTEADFEYFL